MIKKHEDNQKQIEVLKQKTGQLEVEKNSLNQLIANLNKLVNYERTFSQMLMEKANAEK